MFTSLTTDSTPVSETKTITTTTTQKDAKVLTKKVYTTKIGDKVENSTRIMPNLPNGYFS